ncbi:MAG: hypoxanthine phosphoribosyltransferase [Candidatus Eisenbacteria bacterium]|nr:hypoxanthine phosphoribosyltransferase [Candidatus Eisenbacteria bacterium]
MIEAISRLEAGDEIRLTNGAGTILRTAEQIRARISELGRQIASDYAGRVPVLVGILRGGFIFQCDLARAIAVPQEIDFLAVSRFDRLQKGPTAVKILHDLRSDVRDRDVIVIEGIRTSSTKMEFVRAFLQQRTPASLRFAALVCQASARNHPVPLQYKGFDIGDEFVIGCGLDYQERYRNLPVIAAFTPRNPMQASQDAHEA